MRGQALEFRRGQGGEKMVLIGIMRCEQGIGESVWPRSLEGPPARRNRVLEPGPNRAHLSYVNFAPLFTPSGGGIERV